ncbi:MAG TPA: hypothetical protein PLK60_08885, partial [Myxococcota bacterium]|nr:hypothetical protein [Myxococcota bacterium]
VQTEGCGNCGQRSRTCTAACGWSEWGACTGEGLCTPGEVQTEGCGNCGQRSRTCTAACGWSQWGACTGEGVCAPGEVRTQSCGNCGIATAVCGSTCTWGPFGTCTGQGVCTPGAVEEQACGLCGTQSRQCTSECGWTPWSTCGNQGVCAPGATRQVSCGRCGMATETCTASCTWGGAGPCTGEGACAPGDTGSCENCGSRVCSSLCQWGTCNIGTVDAYEENDSSTAAKALPDITDNDSDARSLYANINPSYDQDWYRVHVADRTGYQIDPWVSLSQVPAGQTYQLCVHYLCDQNGNPPARQCVSSSGATVRIDLDVSGCDDNCGIFCYDNSGTLIIQVLPVTIGSCSNYRLDYGA